MQENEVDHLIKINRWLYACARFIEASKELTDYDIEGINRVIDIMKSSGTSDRIKSDIVRCGECVYQYHNAYGAAYCKHGYLFGAINDNTGCTYGKKKEATNETD